MRNLTKLSCTLVMSVATLCLGGTAMAQVTTIVEPIKQYKTLDSLPIEYGQNGVIKAQHIRPGDISPEEYAKLLAEADRVRAYQSHQGNYSGVSYDAATNATVTPNPVGEVQTPIEIVTSTAPNYEIQLYETPLYEPNRITEASIPSVISQAAQSHYVVKGDTLYNIARRFDVSVNELKQFNNLANNGINLGQTLRIPGPTSASQIYAPHSGAGQTSESSAFFKTIEAVPAVSSARQNGVYAVLPKDTLYSISRRACVSVGALQATNAISNPSALQPGQKLVMPSGHCL